MAEEYIVRSGAKEQLAHAVAELFTTRPKIPVRFLAMHFQPLDNSNKIAKSAAILQNSAPRLPAFHDAVERAMRLLNSSNAITAPHAAAATTISITVPTPSTRATIISDCSVARADYSNLVSYLCADLAEERTQKVVEALLSSHEKEPDSSALVAIDEFERGVRMCLVLEELLDTLDQLFHLVDKNESGQISSQTLLTALDSAASIAQAQPEGSMSDLLALVHSAIDQKPSDEPSVEPVDEQLRWPELQELIARAVFAP